jgi:hypothetical protein
MHLRIATLLVSLPLLLTAASAPDITGKWIGTFEELSAGGAVARTSGAYMEFRISGQTVTGTAGESESEQHEISNGKFDGGKHLTFELARPEHPTMKFDLVLEGETIKGPVSAESGSQRLAARVTLARKILDRPADREAIRAHIDRIFQAFIHKNEAELRATHARNWLGYLEGSTTMIHGLDGYMDWSAHFDPKSPYGMTGYKMREFDILFHGGAAFVPFVAEVDANTPRGPYHRVLRITDFYTKENGEWIQSGSDTDLHSESVEQQGASLYTLSEGEKKRLLSAREAVWRAWFGGDRAALERLLPAELLAIGPGGGPWENRQATLDGSARFAASGGKLVRLEFPKTEIQAFGSTAVVYSDYFYETEVSGQRSQQSGRVTEVFVRRNGEWVNPSWHMDSGK